MTEVPFARPAGAVISRSLPTSRNSVSFVFVPSGPTSVSTTGDTGSLKARLKVFGAAASTAACAGLEEISEACASAGPQSPSITPRQQSTSQIRRIASLSKHGLS